MDASSNYLFRSLVPLTAPLTLGGLLFAPGACNKADESTTVATAVQRDTAPNVAPTDLAALVASNTDFAFTLYSRLSTSAPTNLFYSPYSISLALAMMYSGAGGETATQMASALKFNLPPTTLHPAFNKLDLTIQATPTAAADDSGGHPALDVANAIWGDASIRFNQGFVDKLAENYGAKVRTVDFRARPTQAETAINQWVSHKTHDKIPSVFSPDAIGRDTQLVLVNAVYFKAAWKTTFDKGTTQTKHFTRLDGSPVMTPMMSSGDAATAYAKGDHWQAVELPYAGGTTSMVVVLPDAGTYATVEKSLSRSFYAAVTSALAPRDVELTLPSFRLNSPAMSLVPILQGIGMTNAFGKDADFSAMAGESGLQLTDIVHQAFVDVDETGTEAAAGTGATIGYAAVVLPVVVTVDHPFFFFIRNVATNTVLFVGREGDPTAN